MKKFLILLAFIVFATTHPTKAQKQDNYMMIQQKRVEYLITKLNLTVEESQKFWPLYNEFNKKENELSVENRAKFGDHERLKPGSETDYLKAVNGLLDFRLKREQLFNTYYRRFLQILSAEKVYMLYRFEEEFNKVLLRQLRESPPKDTEGPPTDRNKKF